MRWYAVQTYARHEKAVLEHLSQRSIDAFLPLYSQVRRWRNRVNATVQLPLFPGYVFVRIDPSSFGCVVRTPSVASLVSFGADPMPLPDLEIEALRDRITALGMEPHPFIHIGDRVRVVRGVLAGLEGTLVNKKGKYRLVLCLDMLMQAASVLVDAADVVPKNSGISAVIPHSSTAVGLVSPHVTG